MPTYSEPVVIAARAAPGKPALDIARDGQTVFSVDSDGNSSLPGTGGVPTPSRFSVELGTPDKILWDGNPLNFTDPSAAPPPFPVLNDQPIRHEAAGFTVDVSYAGYRTMADGTNPDIHLVSTVPSSKPFEFAFSGTGVLTFSADSDVVTTPALPLAMLPGGVCRVVCDATGSYTFSGASLITVPGAPRNGVAPSISCVDPRVGQTVTLDHPGGWDGNPDSKTVQWLRDAVTPIGTGLDTYVLVTADGNHAVTASVTTTNWRGTSAAKASNVINALPAAAAIPTVNVAPVLSGSAVTGQTLSVTDGTYNNNPTSVTKQWQHDIGAGFVNIGGATANTYGPLAGGDVGFPLRCIVTATNTAGSVATTLGPVTPTSSSTSLATVVPYDMANAVAGHSGRSQTPDKAEAPPRDGLRGASTGRYQGDWSFQPTTNASSLSFINTYPRLAYTSVLYQRAGGNPTQTCVELGSAQLWIEYADGSWARKDYSKSNTASNYGSLFPENWSSSTTSGGGVSPGQGAQTAVKRASAQGFTLVHLGTNPPPGVAANTPVISGVANQNYLYHSFTTAYDSRNGTGNQAQGNIRRLLFAQRARLDPATYVPAADGKYVLLTGADKKGPNWENGWDLVMGRLKVVEATWKVFTATWSAPLNTGGSFPPNGLTDVETVAEYR